MSTQSFQSLTIHLPTPLYEQLKWRADRAQRSVEEETLEMLATAIPAEDVLPAELTEAMDLLDGLDDSALWNAARTPLAPEVSERLESLHAMKGRGEKLSQKESAELTDLVRQYERQMLVRAKAAVLLRQRGHDVSGLFSS